MSGEVRIGVILSGCGVLDGSEIHEAVLALLCLEQHGAVCRCMAPAVMVDAVNHLEKKPEAQKRNVLAEAARIARGQIDDLAKVNVEDYDGFIVPGGFGSAKNLSSFAFDGAACRVHEQVERVLRSGHEAGKPMGFVCISPVLAARVFGKLGVKVTIGHDAGTAGKVEAMGAKHVACDAKDFVVDETHKILSTPAYMEAKSLGEVYQGVHAMVGKLVRMCRK